MDAADLALVEKLELRLGGTRTTEQLEACTSSFLVPLLHKLSTSDFPSVRGQTVNLLAHWSRRLRSEESVPLPVSPMLDLLQGEGGYDIPASPYALPLLLVLLQMGIQRIDRKVSMIVYF
jgi:hypothetical protein